MLPHPFSGIGTFSCLMPDMAESPKTLLISSVFIRWLPLILLSVVLTRHFWVVYSYSINLPYQDDIFDFLQFFNRVESAGNTEDFLEAFFAQYNDHRTTASRVQVYVAYLLEGEVNFRTQAVLGNIGLLLILLLFYQSVRGEPYRWLYLLVAALLLLNLRAYDIMVWGQPAFAYFYVYGYSFACLFALHKVTVGKFALAVILASLASLTFALGLVVWLLGLASLLHQSFVTGTRSWKYPVIWLLVTVVAVLLWHVGFTPTTMEVAPEDVKWVRRFSPGFLSDPTISELLVRYAAVVLVTVGSAVTDTSTLVAGAFGVTLLVLLSYVTIRDFRHEDIRLALCCWFAVSAAPAMAMGRAIVGTPEFFLRTNNRYGFFSVMVLCTLCMLVQLRFNVFKTRAVYVLVVLAALFYAWTYREFEPRLQELVERRYSNYNEDRIPVFGHAQWESRAIIGKAVSGGRLTLPCRPYPECESSSGGGR